MGTNQRNWARHGRQLLLGICFLSAGCVRRYAAVPEPPPLPPLPAILQAAAHDTPQLPAPRSVDEVSGPLSLDQLLALAAQNNPDLAIARAQAEAARGRLVQAGLYPNPMVSWEGDDMDNPQRAAGKQGPVLQQQIVTGGKLGLDQAAAAQGVAMADWQALTRWYDVVTRVRLAYFELLTAQRDVQTNEEAVHIADLGLSVAERLRRAGLGTEPDIKRAQVDLEENRIRLSVAQRRLEAARRLLMVAVGVNNLSSTVREDPLEAAAPVFEWQSAVAAVTERSSEIHEAHAAVFQAEQQLRRAYAEVIPNLQINLHPFYHFPEQDMQYFVQVGANLPIFNRNQGNIVAAQANLGRAYDTVRQVELRLAERLALAFQRYQAARDQTESYQKRILPNAAESLRLIRLGYSGGDPKYDYTAVLQAQRTLVQARLTYVQALGELWRGVSDIAGLLQQDQLTGPSEPSP